MTRAAPVLAALLVLVTAAGTTSGATAAAAAPGVTVTDETITVRADGAGAVVTRAPFRLAFTDGSGDVVLEQVPNTSPAPYLAPNVDDEPGGAENVPDNVLYEPFAYEVGGAASPQFPATSWVGNLLLGGSAGVQYSAREVLDVQESGGGVRMTVSTNDPSGRTLEVSLRPDRPGALAVQARLSSAAGVSAISDSFTATADEAFHGFGGRHSGVDLRGRSPVNWIQEENFGAGPLEPGREQLPGTDEHYLFPNGPTAAYYVHNSFVSSQGYGFLLDRPELSRYRLAYGRDDAWQVDVAGAELDYVVAPGDGRTAVRTLTGINGRHRVPPAWTQGLTLYRGVRVLSPEGDDAASYEAKVRDDLEMIDATGLPVTSYAIEGWDLISRDVLKDLIAELKARGIHVMAYFRAYVSADVANTEDPAQFTEAVEGGYLARTATGAPYFYGSSFVVGVAGLVDFTNPEAVAWWEGRVREALDLGIDGFMQDFGEQVQQDMHFTNGETGLTMHNTYPNVFHRVTREVFDRYEAEHPERELFFFTRAGFSGRPGSAAYENANFPGDETSDWNLGSGLPSIVPDMLNRGVGGSYGFTTDIGGYADYLSGSPTAELYTRWAQAASLTTFMRVHNSSSTGVRMPWSYDEATLQRFAASAALHERARPLVRALWTQAQTTGQPVMRPMWLEFPDSPEARSLSYQWMLGPDVLVAPVLAQGATTRDVWFPPGCWESEATGSTYDGPATVTVEAPLDLLPWFVRCGTQPLGVAPAVGGAPAAQAPAAAAAGTAAPSGAAAPAGAAATRSRPVLAATGPVLPAAAGLLALAVAGGLARRRRGVAGQR